jgi:hypothetical protein
MIDIKVDVRNLEAFIRGLATFRKRLEDRSEPLEDIKKLQAERWIRNFASGGGEYIPWKANAQGTQPLFQSGRTFGIFSDQSNSGQVSSDAAKWEFENVPGGRRWYSPVSHDAGYVLGKSAVWSRPMMLLDEKDGDRAEKIIYEWVISLEDELL